MCAFNSFESETFAMKSARFVGEQRMKITFNRFISELRFTTKPSNNSRKSIYPRTFRSPIPMIVGRATLALHYQTIIEDDRMLPCYM